MTRPAKAAIFYDVPDWAFHNVARNVARVTQGCDITLYGRDDWFGRSTVVQGIAQTADVLVFLWRFDILAFLDCLDAASWRRFTGPGRPALVTVVYDHLYQDRAALAEIGDPFAVSDLVCVSSERLRRIYDASPDLPQVFCTLPDGVDLTRFTPCGQVFTHRPPTIGWVGNSRWASTLADDLKGRRTVFDPALSLLKTNGWAFDTRLADAAERRIPHAHMPAFYHDLDILVCTSAMEGTPNPVLEAMACGIVIVTSDVGVVREVLGARQSAFILPERSPGAFATALERLLGAPGLRAELRAENLARRDTLGWSARAPLWEGMLETALNVRHGVQANTALAAYRSRSRSGIERARKLVATNPLAFRAYETLRLHAPGVIRRTKRLLERGAR
jgi:hypothetical protein